MARRRRLPAALRCALLAAVVLGACSGDEEPETPAATAPAPTDETTTTTAEPRTPEEEVEAAYLRSWEVYAEAVRELDSSQVDTAYAGEAFTTVVNEVERYRRNDTPVRVEVEHDYAIQLLEPGLAAVIDRYVNHSVFVDPSTGEPTEDDPNKLTVETYTLKEFEGTWKVTAIVGQS